MLCLVSIDIAEGTSTHQPSSERIFIQPEAESTLQQASPAPRCPIAPGLRLGKSCDCMFLELASLVLRSSSVCAYGGGAPIVGGGDVGRAVFDIVEVFVVWFEELCSVTLE